MLRGSFPRSVRAPNVVKLFIPATVALDGTYSSDPCAKANPVASAAGCARTGVSAAKCGHRFLGACMTHINRRTMLRGATAALAFGSAAKSQPVASAATLASSLPSDGPHPSLGHHAETYGRFIGSWAGEYKLFTLGGTKLGRSKVSFGWVLEGRAIQDCGWAIEGLSETDTDGPGSTLRIFDPDIKAWRIIFVDPVHHRHNEMVGRRVGDDVIQQGYYHDRVIKWTFGEVTAASFTWRGYHLADDGEKWVMTEEYRFRRVV
jgi:hypothetical protein